MAIVVVLDSNHQYGYYMTVTETLFAALPFDSPRFGMTGLH
jgi:hypothetical protein